MRLHSDRPTTAIKSMFNNARKALENMGINVPELAKAGVPAGDMSDLPFQTGADELLPLVEEQVLLSRLPGATEVSVSTRLIITVGGAVAYAVGEKKPIPAVPVELDAGGLLPHKFAALTVRSNESIAAGGAVTERGVQNALVRGVSDVTNGYILGSQAASAASDAGFAHGVSPINATSDPVADIRALIAAHVAAGSDITSSAFITDPNTAAILGTVTGADGGLLFPDVGIHGGTLLGLPVLVTRANSDDSPPPDSLYLVDGSAVSYSLDGVELSVAKHATVEMSTVPTGDGDTPATASQQMVSMFQNELSALKIVLRASWRVGRTGAVNILAGISY